MPRLTTMLQGKIILSRAAHLNSAVTLDRTLIVSRASLSLYINAAPRRAAYPLCVLARAEGGEGRRRERERDEEFLEPENFRLFSLGWLIGKMKCGWTDLGYPRNLGEKGDRFSKRRGRLKLSISNSLERSVYS